MGILGGWFCCLLCAVGCGVGVGLGTDWVVVMLWQTSKHVCTGWTNWHLLGHRGPQAPACMCHQLLSSYVTASARAALGCTCMVTLLHACTIHCACMTPALCLHDHANAGPHRHGRAPGELNGGTCPGARPAVRRPNRAVRLTTSVLPHYCTAPLLYCPSDVLHCCCAAP